MKLTLINVALICAYLGRADELPLSTPSSPVSSPSSLPPNVSSSSLPSQESATPSPTTLPPSKESYIEEDKQIIYETIRKYDFPGNSSVLGLPGPELKVDNAKLLLDNKLVSSESGAYILRIRTITNYFSYNGRYEEANLRKLGDRQILVIKGQFGEHFERKSGGFYVRTIGYTLDENGYQQFLIDLTTAQTTLKDEEIDTSVDFIFPGGPEGNKVTISSTALGTLIGGNSLG